MHREQKTRLAGYLLDESNRATGRERNDEVERLLTSLDDGQPSLSQNPSSLLAWAKSEISTGRFRGIPWFFLAMGKYFESMGKWSDAGEWYRMAMEQSDENGYPGINMDSRLSLGHLRAKTGESKEARRVYTAALREAEGRKDQLSIMRALGGMGALRYDQGAFTEARFSYQRVVRLAEKIGDRSWKAHMLNDLGAVLSAECKYKMALRSFESALRIYESQHYERGMARCLNNMANACLEAGDLVSAGIHFRKSHEISSSFGWEELEVINLLGRAEVMLYVTEFETSLSLSREAGARATGMGDPYSQIEAQRISASVLYEQGDKSLCFQFLQESVERAKQVGALYALARVLESRAQLWLRETKFARASADLKKAAATYEKLGLKERKKQVGCVQDQLMRKGG